ncbi:MAG: Yip1 family protein [Rhodoferax sp.]|jgi:hypothetical protein
MDIVGRARAMVVNPGPTWVTVEQEPTDWQKLYVPYMVILAAIPAVASFIYWSILGVGGFGFSMRLPILTGLGMAISNYVMTLVMVFVWGWLISQLANTFGGTANLMNGVKLTVYASTPAMLAGVFMAIPGLSMLSILGSCYSLYLLYLGLPVLMKNPAEKSISYLVVAAIVGIVGAVLISLVSNIFMPSPMSRMHSMNGINGTHGMQISTPKGNIDISTASGSNGDASNPTMTIKSPDGEVKIDMQGMQDFAKKMEAVAAEQQKAQQKQ